MFCIALSIRTDNYKPYRIDSETWQLSANFDIWQDPACNVLECFYDWRPCDFVDQSTGPYRWMAAGGLCAVEPGRPIAKGIHI